MRVVGKEEEDVVGSGARARARVRARAREGCGGRDGPCRTICAEAHLRSDT